MSVMVRHTVFFKMKERTPYGSATDSAGMLAVKFAEISVKIPGVIACETGMNFNTEPRFYDMCLTQLFESRQFLEDYLAHPLHVTVREYVFQVIDHRIVVDYDII